MFKLVIFADVAGTERALVESAAKVPDAPLTFGTHGVLHRTKAAVRGQAFLPVADPRFAVVAYGTL